MQYLLQGIYVCVCVCVRVCACVCVIQTLQFLPVFGPRCSDIDFARSRYCFAYTAGDTSPREQSPFTVLLFNML